MPLRIAFDMDGVLADMERALAREAEAASGDAAAPNPREPPDEGGDAPADAPPPTRLRLTPRQERRLWARIAARENFWESLDEQEPGAVARLHTAAIAGRWEVMFLTSRPPTAGAPAQLQTQRWLAARGFPLPSVYVVAGSRGRIADALDLDVVVDDRPENCLEVVAHSRARAILVWRAGEHELPDAAKRLGIAVVSTVDRCVEILSQEDARPPRTGMLDRVMRRLGLKEPA